MMDFDEEAFQLVRNTPEMARGSKPARERVVREALRRAYLAGAESMRERAEKTAAFEEDACKDMVGERVYGGVTDPWEMAAKTARVLARRIRRIPLQEGEE